VSDGNSSDGCKGRALSLFLCQEKTTAHAARWCCVGPVRALTSFVLALPHCGRCTLTPPRHRH
jgi:hypothetical protein